MWFTFIRYISSANNHMFFFFSFFFPFLFLFFFSVGLHGCGLKPGPDSTRECSPSLVRLVDVWLMFGLILVGLPSLGIGVWLKESPSGLGVVTEATTWTSSETTRRSATSELRPGPGRRYHLLLTPETSVRYALTIVSHS